MVPCFLLIMKVVLINIQLMWACSFVLIEKDRKYNLYFKEYLRKYHNMI